MGESVKATCALVLIVSVITAAIAWTADQPDQMTWGFRIGGVVLAVLSLGLILALQSRADTETDYLAGLTGSFFNRDGFCFAIVANEDDGIGFIDIYFQSQHDQRSIGRIALRPGRGFLMNRASIEPVAVEVDCPPAGFGVARIAMPIPEKLQGKQQTFEVGASVEYPDGKGTRVRFRDGIFLRANSNFGNSFSKALTVAGAATGSIVLSKPATVKLALPDRVVSDLPEEIEPEVRILWQIGDPALDAFE